MKVPERNELRSELPQRKDELPEKKDELPEKKDEQPEKKDEQPEKKDELPGKKEKGLTSEENKSKNVETQFDFTVPIEGEQLNI